VLNRSEAARTLNIYIAEPTALCATTVGQEKPQQGVDAHGLRVTEEATGRLCPHKTKSGNGTIG
jgi:hypothetical protein